MKGDVEHNPTHEMTQHEADQEHITYRNANGDAIYIPAGDRAARYLSCGKEPCTNTKPCEACVVVNGSFLRNRDGYPAFRGNNVDNLTKLFCNRFFGANSMPGGDGYCGPNNGPQCEACSELTVVAPKNSNGAFVAVSTTGKFYCTRWSQGEQFCDPFVGHQCSYCADYQEKHPNPSLPTPFVYEPSPADRFKWRKNLLNQLLESGAITQQQYSVANKQNKQKLGVKSKVPAGLTKEVHLFFKMLDTSEELVISKTRVLWDKYDTNKNGNLEFDEAQKFFKDFEEANLRVLGAPVPKEEDRQDGTRFGTLYDEIDTNHSGGIDFDEFVTWLKKKKDEVQMIKKFTPAVEDLAKAMENLAAAIQ